MRTAGTTLQVKNPRKTGPTGELQAAKLKEFLERKNGEKSKENTFKRSISH
jgi:hypothetical protein